MRSSENALLAPLLAWEIAVSINDFCDAIAANSPDERVPYIEAFAHALVLTEHVPLFGTEYSYERLQKQACAYA